MFELEEINKKANNSAFFYWFATFNLCPIIGYIPNGTFSTEGDVGRFVSGLHISPWFIFIPGTILVSYLVYNLLGKKLYGLFYDLDITNIIAQRFYLWFSIFILFFLIYTHGYNPFSDSGALLLSKIIAAITLVIAILLIYLFDPAIGPLVHDGATVGGYREYADALIKRDAKINVAEVSAPNATLS